VDLLACALLVSEGRLKTGRILRTFPDLFIDDLTEAELKEGLKSLNYYEESLFEFHHYWDAIRDLVDTRIRELKIGNDHSYSLVARDVEKLLLGRSESELGQLENEIEHRLSDHVIDSSFMKFILNYKISNFKNKNKIRQIHENSQKILGTGSSVLPLREAVARADPITRAEEQLLAQLKKLSHDEDERVWDSEGTDGPIRKKWAEGRRPKFVNFIREATIWTKYAQAHYTADNPPPKQVTGYRFNVAYPGLKVAPKYTIERGDTEDTLCLRIAAGEAPWEDLLFRIRNKEWDLNRFNGWKCEFTEEGILQLHFRLKLDKYRR
jgi:hypothetical protein